MLVGHPECGVEGKRNGPQLAIKGIVQSESAGPRRGRNGIERVLDGWVPRCYDAHVRFTAWKFPEVLKRIKCLSTSGKRQDVDSFLKTLYQERIYICRASPTLDWAALWEI